MCVRVERAWHWNSIVFFLSERVCRTRWCCLYIGAFPSCYHPITVSCSRQNFHNSPRMLLPRIPGFGKTTLSTFALTPQTDVGHYVVLRMNTEAIPIANAKPCFRLRKQCGSTFPSTWWRSKAWFARYESFRPPTEKLCYDRTNHGDVHLGCSTVCA